MDALARKISGVLVGLVVFDFVLVVWISGFPTLWTATFHGTAPIDPHGLMPRMAANWAAFFSIQLWAALRWRRTPTLLLLVAGVRLSDVFTDITYVLAADQTTWFAWIALPFSSLMNAAIGFWLLRTFEALKASPEAAA